MNGEQQREKKLQDAKAKAKLAEFTVPKESYPDFLFDSDDLCFNAMHALSAYTNAKLTKCRPDDNLTSELKRAASFYDAASNDSAHKPYKNGFWLLAMSTYFLLENFGSAAVASDYVEDPSWYGPMGEKLYDLVRYLLRGEDVPEKMGLPKLVAYIRGDDISLADVNEEAKQLLNSDNPENHLFGKICRVAIDIAVKFAARRLLPLFSDLDISSWREYLSSKGADHLLWQAQECIGKKGAFRGKNLFVQLPTGTGKTNSIQLLIRSRVLAGTCKQVVVMAPLRALCSELIRDLSNAVSDIADVSQSTDALEQNAWIRLGSEKPRVLVFTPERFAYVERHVGGLISSTDLFILDEAHLIDDSARGAAYELTIAEIMQKNAEAQIVMLSAVVSNPSDIAAWAMGDAESCVSGTNLPRAEKSLGILDKGEQNIEFFDSAGGKKSTFTIRLPLKEEKFKPLGKEHNAIVFPYSEKSSTSDAQLSRDAALYVTKRIIKNGPVAIYLPQARSVAPCFKRLQELSKHGWRLFGSNDAPDRDEVNRIRNLANMHYGCKSGNPFDGGILLGILPHYGDLQGCLRQVVEDELEDKEFKCVVCTSTLAQGVNLPIKYLIITGVQSSQRKVKTRDFQNLIGRTARSGKFSEGSILISDLSIHKRSREDYRRLLDSQQTERCESAIAKLFNDVNLGKDKGQPCSISGDQVINLMLEGIGKRDAATSLTEDLKRYGLDRVDISERLSVFSAIETYVSGMLDQGSDDIDALSLCKGTFAYSTADDAMRERLVKLFKVICENLENADAGLPLTVYSKTQMGIVKTEQLKSWLESSDGHSLLTAADDAERIRLICGAYQYCSQIRNEWLDAEILAELTNMWMRKETLSGMVDRLENRHSFPPRKKPNIHKVEKALGSDISFGLANFILCIADMLGPVLGESVPDCLPEALEYLHEKVKFGIESSLGCTICKEIFADRMVADGLAEILGSDERVPSQELKQLMENHEAEVERYLHTLPAYFLKRYIAWKQHIG